MQSFGKHLTNISGTRLIYVYIEMTTSDIFSGHKPATEHTFHGCITRCNTYIENVCNIKLLAMTR